LTVVGKKKGPSASHPSLSFRDHRQKNKKKEQKETRIGHFWNPCLRRGGAGAWDARDVGGSGSGNMALRNIETGLRLLTKIDQVETGGLAPVLREFQKPYYYLVYFWWWNINNLWNNEVLGGLVSNLEVELGVYGANTK